MNLYDVREIEAEIDQIAKENEGEIPEDKWETLVIAKTQALNQVEKLVQYIRHLELGIENVDSEIERLQTIKTHANNRINSIKSYLLPFVNSSSNSKIEVGTFKLSIRKSEQVIVDESLLDKQYLKEKISYTPAKDAIKLALKSGIEVTGAYLKQNFNLQIK